MKEQLQGKLVEILTQIQSTVGKASDFALEQLPDVAMQYIHFKMVWYGIELLVFGAITVYLWKSGSKFFRKYKDTCDGDYGFCAGVFRIGSVICSLFFFHNLYYGLMVLIAPKIWFIYQMIDLVKSVK